MAETTASPRRFPAMAAVNSGNLTEVGLGAAVVGILVVMILPLPTFLLDLLIAFNITFAVVILLLGSSWPGWWCSGPWGRPSTRSWPLSCASSSPRWGRCA